MGFVLLVAAMVAAWGLFFYWFYVPAPARPALQSVIRGETLQVGTLKRTYQLYAPPMAGEKGPVPLVIVLHGTGIDGRKIREWTGFEFDQMADQNHFVVAYPDGIGGGWNDLTNTRATPAKKRDIDDIGFLKALIETSRQQHNVDPARVYAFGYSNGGSMIFRVAAQEPGLFAAAATVAAALPTPEYSLFAMPFRAAALPILLVNGTADSIIPYEGGKIRFFGQKRGAVLGALATASNFAATHGILEAASDRILHREADSDPTQVKQQTWMKDGKPAVILYSVQQGGHVVPQPLARFPRFLGAVTRHLNAPREALRFFGLHAF